MEIRILVAGEQIGPYSETEVRQYLGQGLVSPFDLAVMEGMAEWQPLESLLADLPPAEAHHQVPMLDESSENIVETAEPVRVEMYPEPPAAFTEEISPDVPPVDHPLPAIEPVPMPMPEAAVAETPREILTGPASSVIQVQSSFVPVREAHSEIAPIPLPEPSPEPVAVALGTNLFSAPTPNSIPVEPILTMPKETNLEENPPAPTEPNPPLTATQKTKRNKIVIQPILPLATAGTAPVPAPLASTQKKLKTGRTALTIEPPRPTTALPPVAGFVPRDKEKDKDRKPGRQVVRTGPVSMGDLFDKAAVAHVTPAQPPLLPVTNPAPAVAASPALDPVRTPTSTTPTPALEAPKSSKPPVLPTMTAVLSKPDFPSSKAWVKGIPNYIIYTGFTAAILVACMVAFVVFLLMSGHDNGPAPNPTGNAPPPAEHASAAPTIEIENGAAPVTAADFSQRGTELEKQGDLAGALAAYNKSLDLKADNLKTRYLRALLLETKGNWDGALADYNTILSSDSKNADAFSNRGFVKQAQGDADGALADYRQALSLNPKISAAYYNQGLIKVQKGDLDGAIADYNQALLLDPKMAIAYYNRGNAKNTEGNLEGAIADYTQALEIDPTIALAYCNRGFARQTKGDLDGALSDYTQAVGINPKMAVAFYNRGLIRVQKDDLPGAIEDSSRAIDLDPKNAQAYCNRGLARMGRGDLDGAMADLRKFCDISPRDSGADAARLYMWVLSMKQNPKGSADPDLSTALQNDWNSPPEDLTSKIGAFLLGHLREKDLIANAASPDPSREPGQYCKAWYFAGIKRLLAHDATTAVTDFQKCVATNQDTFCEYIFAKAELAAMATAHDSSAQATTP